MSTILLSIGSNTFAKTNIDKAKRMLSNIFQDIQFSEPIFSEPEDDKYKYLFRNILASCQTEMTPEEVIEKIKLTERAVGRSPKDKYLGKVVIDIDLLKYNEEILRPQDYEREYIQQLLTIFEIEEPAEPQTEITESSADVVDDNTSDNNTEDNTEDN